MVVHIQYNLRSNKTNDNPPKKAVETNNPTEMKKRTEAKKTLDASLKKVPEKNNVESPAKRNSEILQRSNQTEVTSTSQLSTSAHITTIEKLEFQGLRKSPTTFRLEGELAK
jgi:hypothetical protein